MAEQASGGDRNGVSIGIAETAKLVGISAATIRSWERIGLVRPGRTATGHRRFTLEDVETLRRIHRLRESDQLGLTAIQRLMVHQVKSAPPPPPADAGTGDWRERLRQLRAKAGLSLRDITARTGLSPSFVSSIERGRANPSVGALQKLTAAYQTSIVDLMGGNAERPMTLVRPADRKIYDITTGVKMEQLNVGDHRMELHLFVVEPGAGTGEAYRHEGEEFIYLLQGRLTVWIDQVERYELTAGDVLYFESPRPHEWVNPGEEQAVFLGVNTPATF